MCAIISIDQKVVISSFSREPERHNADIGEAN